MILEIILEVLLNILLMFCILSILFVLFISKIETTAYENEINDQIQKNINIYLDQANKSSNFKVARTLKLFFKENPNIDKIIASNTQNISQESNRWLFICIFMSIGFLLFLFLFFCFMLQFAAHNDIYLYKKISWTLLIFTFVGAVEGGFFYKVGMKYVPTPPSTLVDSIIDQLKKW